MFSGRAEEDPAGFSRSGQGDREDGPAEAGEKKSPVIENHDLAFPGAHYRVASDDDFWAELSKLSEEETEQFIALTSEIMLKETMKDDLSLRFLRGVAFFRKARLDSGRKGGWDNDTLDMLEESLGDFHAADAFAGNDKPFPHIALEENRDAAAKALEGERPGRAQEILGKTKLAYMGNRLYVRSPQHAPSVEEVAIFENVFFHYPGIVRSAEIFYRVLGEPGRRYINVLLYEETSPLNSAGEANAPLCIMGLVEDGTFHLVKDLVGDAANAGGKEEEAEIGGSPNEEQSGREARDMKAAGEAIDPGGVAGRAGGWTGKTARLLIFCAVLLLLISTVFFLKFYRPKPASEPGKQVTPRQTAGHQSLPSEAENRPSITGQPERPDNIKGNESRRAPAQRLAGKVKKLPPETKATGTGRTITTQERTKKTPSEGNNKRSFPPHSRDDL